MDPREAASVFGPLEPLQSLGGLVVANIGFVAFFVAIVLLVAGGLAGPALLQRWRRARVSRGPFPAAWRAILRRRWPRYATLPPDVQRRVRDGLRVLLAEVPIVGCAGLVIGDEQRVLIAAQAALMLAGRGGSFANLREILVYPGHFVVEREKPLGAGLVMASRQVLAGESWHQGRVVLAWDAVLDGAADPHDGANVVFHEFAHQLDQETGPANGAPHLSSAAERERWAAVMNREFDALRWRLAQAPVADMQDTSAAARPLIDPYGATEPAEFFAVTSELFFERPAELAAAHPALFGELQGFYRCDPRTW